MRILLFVGCVAVLAGCGTVTTTFHGDTPLAIKGTPPPPPPPPAPKEAARVEVKDDRIQINEKIQFAVASSVIRSVSFSLLDEVVKAMQDHPEIKKIEVQGHASSEGGAEYNKQLSDARAKSVMAYLVAHGVAKDRLTAHGYGIEKPLADNSTEDGREQNRRVEFIILEQDSKP